MILTDDNLAPLVAAVEEGRGDLPHIHKTVKYLLAGNCDEFILMTACVNPHGHDSVCRRNHDLS
jgi:magnesium-transporting ATPase (P-type)